MSELYAPRQVLLHGRRAMLVRLTCKEGMRAALLDLLNTYADRIGEEPGTEVFVVSIDPESVSTVWLYEVFKDDDAQLAHRSAPAFGDLVNGMRDFVEGQPAVLRMDPLRMSMNEDILNEDWDI